MMVCLFYACFGCQYGLIGLWKEQYGAAAASGVSQSDRFRLLAKGMIF